MNGTYIDHSSDMSLYWRRRQQEVDLVVIVAETPEVLDGTQTCLTIGDSSIEVMLFAVLINAEAFKVDVPIRAKLCFDWARDEDRRLHVELLLTAFHDGEANGDDAGDLLSSTERDLAVALTEMKITNRELGTRNMDGKKDS